MNFSSRPCLKSSSFMVNRIIALALDNRMCIQPMLYANANTFHRRKSPDKRFHNVNQYVFFMAVGFYGRSSLMSRLHRACFWRIRSETIFSLYGRHTTRSKASGKANAIRVLL